MKFKLPARPRQNLSRLPLFKLFYVCLGVNILAIAAVFLLQKNIPPQIPLYYGLPEGEEQLTNTLGLTIPSFAALGILLVNILTALIIKNDFLKKTLAVTSLGVTILSFVTTVKIFFLVGSFNL